MLDGTLVSVIVVNFNGLRFLRDCLRAVLDQQVNAEFEVILVDNGSIDDSVPFVRQNFPTVRLITVGRNRGFAGGNNIGMMAALGRYLVLLNNDTRVRPGWLQALVNAAETDERIGAVAAKLVFMQPAGTIQNAGSLLLSDGSGADRGFREPDRGQFDRREEVFGACGASALYRRHMLEDVGMFDETFFMYYEDTDLNWRMRLRGWRVLYEPAAVVEHVHAGSSVEWSPFFIFHADRNRLLMLVKNAPLAMVTRSFARFGALVAGQAVRLARSRLRPSRGGPDGVATRGRAVIYIRVATSLLVHLPEMLVKRWKIRQRRSTDDAAIARWFYPRQKWDER